MKNSPIGVLLLNMGGPDTQEDIPAFLYNLFSDRDIIKLGPPFMQKVLARFIARKRAPKSKKIYAKIGGGSPLRRITEQQATALEELLQDDGKYIVKVAMRYWQPTADEAVKYLQDAGVTTIIALPLYPHYTKATTGSSFKDLRNSCKKIAPKTNLIEVSSWPDEPGYIDILAEKINQGKAKFQGDDFQLVYSAHSLPISFIAEGDPYVDELNRTISKLEMKTGTKGILCYQSRSGPVEWLSPSTAETIDELAENGCKNILMMPISFVSDHVETLYEIDIQFTEQAAGLGVHLEPTTSLNTDPQFISVLRDLVLRAVADNQPDEIV